MKYKKIKIGEIVKIVKDVDRAKYPATATGLIEMSDRTVGKKMIVYIIKGNKGRISSGYAYGGYPLGTLVYFRREELKTL